ncbi:MAG TPA: 3-oxoacyl-ACP synthase III [Opitutaceae bacterium]
MIFRDVVLESIVHEIPPHAVSSADLEERLRPLYERLKLPAGRLELMTGIKERRFWPEGTLASDASAMVAQKLVASTRVPIDRIRVMIHGAVSRDMLEPATAAFVHRKAGLPPEMQLFDISNACLGFLNACCTVGAMIDAGHIDAGMIVCGENGGPLVDRTVKRLLAGDLNRNQIKPYFANLTIGSGAVGAVLCHRDMAGEGAPRLVGGVARAATQHNDLCQGDHAGGDGLDMQTDSEQLLLAGVRVARETWDAFLGETRFAEADFKRYVCHQVGVQHRNRLYETLELPLAKDYSTFESFGNVGSVALPITLSRAIESGAIARGDRVGLLGIGSGINCLMLALEC